MSSPYCGKHLKAKWVFLSVSDAEVSLQISVDRMGPEIIPVWLAEIVSL